jgi:hypothetical protein
VLLGPLMGVSSIVRLPDARLRLDAKIIVNGGWLDLFYLKTGAGELGAGEPPDLRRRLRVSLKSQCSLRREPGVAECAEP